ncbi:uncharacterized protein [Palaemon carinicauda]|uniref:uncharacterized protein n=1 Tax=Palaemon carinicauda TaxID=392227 RepID=UPI0035B5B7FD
MRVLLFLLLGIVSLARGDQEASRNVKDEEDSLSIEGDALVPKESMSEKERLFGSFSTTTYTIVSAVTSTVFFSCLSGSDATICQGRNTKRFRRGSRTKAIELEEGDDLLVPSLEPSDLSEPMGEKTSETEESPKEKFGFTVWTTARTTTSVTVFYTNTSTTIRLSYYCIAGGIQYPANNCAG